MRIFGRYTPRGIFHVVVAVFLGLVPTLALAAPYAAMVIDARSGEVIHSRNADTQLHPASLTKMMTLYIAFEAVEHGEISLDTVVTISKKAAAEPPSKLGLRPGQKIKLRYLIRAAAVKSANDAATAIGEALEGSEAAFARRMNRTAKALGMNRSRFKNAHGLTESGHLSTARDMTTLGRHLFYDYPEYYNLFSRITTDAGVKPVSNSNRRFLSSYKGADGIKTGYTRAAGFNLVASAERGGERIITTVFGGRSSASRNEEVARLMNLGFSKAPSRVAVNKPSRPAYAGKSDKPETQGRAIQTVLVINSSKFPRPRPARPGAIPEETLLAMRETIKDAVKEAITTEEVVAEIAPQTIEADTVRPRSRPEALALASIELLPDPNAQEVVTRMSTSGGRHWGINVGRFPTSFEAERELLRTALIELGTLDEALRKVSKSNKGYDANFVGMTQDEAALACRRLSAHGTQCETFGPS